MILHYRKIQVVNPEISRLQDAIKSTLDPITSSPVTATRVAYGVTLKAGLNLVPHGLPYAYTTYWVGNQQGASEVTTGSVDRTQFIGIVATRPCTVDVFFY